MSLARRINLAIKAVSELGPGKVSQFAWYRLRLASGFFYLQTRKEHPPGEERKAGKPVEMHSFLTAPSREQIGNTSGRSGLQDLLAEADEICAGQVRLFGGDPVALELAPAGKLKHWSRYSLGESGGTDIKWVWEPARFGCAFTLGRAFIASGDELYAASFWHFTEAFLAANPPNMGPHWTSAQEVALRLMAFSFALQVFAASPATTPERVKLLVEAIHQHARRIPPTLSYAQAQNNNHLLVEAAGLFTAGSLFPGSAFARRWRDLGWRLFNTGLLHQIDAEGAYMQQSTNYHRLMLHTALWVRRVAAKAGIGLPEASQQVLKRATMWLAELVDPREGRVPNLGPNDGANIFPLASCPFYDYRPTVQAAAMAFLGQPAFGKGPWDEMLLWLGDGGQPSKPAEGQNAEPGEDGMLSPYPSASAPVLPVCPPSRRVLRSPQDDTWAYLRAAHFQDRPGHADQLHVDLWWRGLNIAQDAGTYLYNAPPPWDNALARAFFHNTVTIEGRDQMRRASRFLYLNWAQAQVVSVIRSKNGDSIQIKALHNGYRELGVTHRRAVRQEARGGWFVEDRLVPASPAAQEKRFTTRLHWLLPDWDWRLVNSQLFLQSPYGWIELTLSAKTELAAPPLSEVQLVRAGRVLAGEGAVHPATGWVSPTYGMKTPALSFSLTVRSSLPLLLTSEWKLPQDSDE